MKVQIAFLTASLLTQLSLAGEHTSIEVPSGQASQRTEVDCDGPPDNKENQYSLRVQKIIIPSGLISTPIKARSLSLSLRMQEPNQTYDVNAFPAERQTITIPFANQEDGSTVITEVPSQDIYIPSSERKCGNFDIRLASIMNGTSWGSSQNENLADPDVRKSVRLKGNKVVTVTYDSGLVVEFKILSKKVDQASDFTQMERNLRRANRVPELLLRFKNGIPGIQQSTFQSSVISNRKVMASLRSEIESFKGAKGYQTLVDLYNDLATDLGEKNYLKYYSSWYEIPDELREYEYLLIAP